MSETQCDNKIYLCGIKRERKIRRVFMANYENEMREVAD